MLADIRRSRNIEVWLRNLFEYWSERDGRRNRLDERDIGRLEEYLRPDMVVPAVGDDVRLFDQVEDARRRMVRLTDDQVRMPLRINCRNTRVILEWIQNALDADLGVQGAGTGPEVRRQTAATRRESADGIAREIVELVDVGGLAPGSVTVLSPFDLAESSASLMPPDSVRRVQRLDEFSMRSTPGDRVGFARIDEFKGLENEAIIVVDLPVPNATAARSSSEHYVAMSRARSVLSLVYDGST